MSKPLSKTRRVEVEAQAWALSQQCWSQPRIARFLGVDQSTVSRALKAARGRAVARLDEDATLWFVTVLEQLEHVADEAMQAWERSKKPKKKASRRSAAVSSTGVAGADQTHTEVIEREGEPAYLSAYYAAIDRIRSLLHLDERSRPKVEAESGPLTVRDCLAEAESADAAYVPTSSPSPEATAP